MTLVKGAKQQASETGPTYFKKPQMTKFTITGYKDTRYQKWNKTTNSFDKFDGPGDNIDTDILLSVSDVSHSQEGVIATEGLCNFSERNIADMLYESIDETLNAALVGKAFNILTNYKKDEKTGEDRVKSYTITLASSDADADADVDAEETKEEPATASVEEVKKEELPV